ncbi:hypothetical protein OsJ_26359 [Oryza sativa Japonica Group]|uniref:BTB domain-containing protein n=1 Tax=Oryza sativa subsp. japonica TaxID=39947 RepID=A3BQI1_ORYSJ|nr:hypothetical protein OsJ_26359 [Oryza sativa Japonica Group]
MGPEAARETKGSLAAAFGFLGTSGGEPRASHGEDGLPPVQAPPRRRLPLGAPLHRQPHRRLQPLGRPQARPPRRADVKAALRCRLISNSATTSAAVDGHVSHAFKRAGESSAWVLILRRSALEASGAIVDDAFTVECTITVITEIPDNVAAAAPAAPANVLPPFSGRGLSLSHHLGELLRRGTGADVTLVVSGKCFPAHRAILASRSPVFMASLFGDMKEKSSRSVEIRDIEPQVFGAMLGFIYTDSVPELDQQDGVVVAQHLLAAADMCGLDGLKIMCEEKLIAGATVETAATTLALAEQHGCPRLKARCVEVVAANLDAVMATEGYKHLMASSPLVMNDLLRAVRGRKS